MSSRTRGFTLIELMITVAIVAILAAIAYPSYREFVRRSDRSDAKTALLEDAQFLERNFTAANQYDKDSAGTAITLPVTQSPRSGAAKYNITLDSSGTSATTFKLVATPTGSMTDDACGNLTLDNQGTKANTGTRSTTECWSR